MCVCEEYHVYIYIFLGVCIYFVCFTELVVHSVLTLVDEIPCYRNYSYYYCYLNSRLDIFIVMKDKGKKNKSEKEKNIKKMPFCGAIYL